MGSCVAVLLPPSGAAADAQQLGAARGASSPALAAGSPPDAPPVGPAGSGPAPAVAATYRPFGPTGLDPDTLERIAEQALPAVVLIDVETPSGSRQGSGFLVTPGGRILTALHVIRDARSARVKLGSGDVYDRVRILGTDERRDIAVIEIAGFDLPRLPLGNSDSVNVGAPVVVIGSPLGLENTVSTGIVSGRRQEPGGYRLLQISAPASTGSSGGPVIARDGRVVGIAVSQMRTGQNLNFAVPINYARGLIDHLSGEPVASLEPSSTGRERGGARPVSEAEAERGVNRGLDVDLGGFSGYTALFEGRTGTDRRHRTRVTYRRIETVGDGEPQIELYVEGETTEPEGPFGTPHTIRRQRSRTIVAADGLQPISARGETTWLAGDEWQRSEYDLRFEDYRARGVIRDSTGRATELDLELPPGVILRRMRDLAFVTIASDSLIGRSVEIVTFDARTGELAHDRYDLRRMTEIRVAGESRKALEVNVASGLYDATAWFGAGRFGALLRREGGEGPDVEEVVELERFRRR